MSLIPAAGLIGRSLAGLAILALIGPAALQAQIGLTSGSARIALIARVLPRVSVAGVSSAREIARQGNVREETVAVRLSANTGYRLVVIGTAPPDSQAGPAPRLWVRSENGRFEEVRSGAVVTVARSRHTVGESEPEVSFRREAPESVEGRQLLPVRYELRIDPTI
ncbi:MAG TPA: hypothetical protein VNO19_06285 [Gemmatimonadales bacterium]|nr:hypothetical protein [Gemmatimonadales bacterium]